MMKTTQTILASLVLCALPFASAAAQDGPKSLVEYNGELVDAEMRPFTGVFSVNIQLFEDAEAEAPVWAHETYAAVEQGRFQLMLNVPDELLNRPIFLAEVVAGNDAVDRNPVQLVAVAPERSRDEIIAELDFIWADLAERSIYAQEADSATDCQRVGGKTLEELDRYDEVLREVRTVQDELQSIVGPRIGGRTTTLERIGGRGGEPFTRMCPPNHVVVGMRGSAGNLIDSIELVCAPLQ